MANPFLISKFNKFDHPDSLRTIFGGNSTFIDPYTTGYHYINFYLPSALESSYGKFLTTVCQSVTVPGITVNNIEYNGTNNASWAYPGTVEYDNKRFTCKFIEFAGLPILQIIGSWVNIFRNLIYGISDPDGNSSTNGTSQIDFKGRAIYATTLFDGKTVQYAAAFTGIYPTKIPTDAFSSDKANHEKVEHDIEFSFDQMYTGPNAIESAQSFVNTFRDSSVSHISNMYNEATQA